VATSDRRPMAGRLRLGQAIEMLDASSADVRRWETEGRLTVERSPGSQRTVAMADVAALLIERSRSDANATVDLPQRNRFRGTVIRIDRDTVAAIVEIASGPHLIVSMLSADAIDAHGLVVGGEAIASVKATSVSVERVPPEPP
jgi:molybdopterin-binding protein